MFKYFLNYTKISEFRLKVSDHVYALDWIWVNPFMSVAITKGWTILLISFWQDHLFGNIWRKVADLNQTYNSPSNILRFYYEFRRKFQKYHISRRKLSRRSSDMNRLPGRVLLCSTPCTSNKAHTQSHTRQSVILLMFLIFHNISFRILKIIR